MGPTFSSKFPSSAYCGKQDFKTLSRLFSWSLGFQDHCVPIVMPRFPGAITIELAYLLLRRVKISHKAERVCRGFRSPPPFVHTIIDKNIRLKTTNVPIESRNHVHVSTPFPHSPSNHITPKGPYLRMISAV